MSKPCGRVSRTETDVRPGGIFSIDIATADGQEFPNLGCFLDVFPMERLVRTSMLFPGEIAVDQFVEDVIAMKSFYATRGGQVGYHHAGVDNKECALPP